MPGPTIDVGTPGFSIDITCAEAKFNGQSLSTGIESMEVNIKQDEEKTWFQGDQDPAERNAGQTDYDLSGVLGTRQFFLFMLAVAGGDFRTLRNMEFELTLLGTPKNDTKIYEFQLHRFRFLNHGFNLDKSPSKDKFTASCMGLDMSIVQTGQINA
jgi:hypothetical protein